MAPRRVPRGEARHAGTGTAELSVAPGGHCTALCRAALRASADALSPLEPDAPTAAAEDPRSLSRVAAGGNRTATRSSRVGRPALGGSLHAGGAEPGTRPDSHGMDAHPAHMSPRVSPAMDS